MKTDTLLREILPTVIVDNFDIDNFEKTDIRFDIWLSEKKVQMREDKKKQQNNRSRIRALPQHPGFPAAWPSHISAYAQTQVARPGCYILVDTGQLRRSIVIRTTENSIIFSTDLPYAAIHNEGGER